MTRLILDAHTHCGYTVPFEELQQEWRHGRIDGGVVFSPVEEIYDRHDRFFTDSEAYRRSRANVHHYLLDLAEKVTVFPYFFVWNDFQPIPEGFLGIKWHRHPDEPVYNYDAPECEARIVQICEQGLPIVLEEELNHCLSFIERIAGRTVVIVPHLGALNGGYYALKSAGVFDHSSVWADTALAGRREIEDYATTYGTDRLMFGSDYPFGTPAREKHKVEQVFSGDDQAKVLGGNLLRLLNLKESSIAPMK